jgi:cathepsin A (carboxypeptidase C)
MRLLASTLLVGSAAAAVSSPQQQVLKPVQDASKAFSGTLKSLQDNLASLSGEAKATWDDVSQMFPESFENLDMFPAPKPHTRHADSKWDHIIKGADVQSVWVEDAQGQKHREVDGHLEDYNLRTKKVDPSKLGVDPGVKQYSGYLDDEENDKHLFYCKQIVSTSPIISLMFF